MKLKIFETLESFQDYVEGAPEDLMHPEAFSFCGKDAMAMVMATRCVKVETALARFAKIFPFEGVERWVKRVQDAVKLGRTLEEEESFAWGAERNQYGLWEIVLWVSH